MNDSSLRSSRVMLTAGIVICSLLAVVSIMNLTPGRMPRLLSVNVPSNEVTEANRQLSASYSEFYPSATPIPRVPVRTISHTDKNTAQKPTANADEPKQAEKHRDVFQRDQVVDADRVAKSEFRKSLRHFSTTTVVEKHASTAGDAASSEEIESSRQSASTDVASTNRRSAADRIDSRSTMHNEPSMPAPHITVPVTVNVDNGEILSELMRIQEQVLVTRSQLDDMTVRNEERSRESMSSVPSTPEEVDSTFDSIAPSEVVAREPDSIESAVVDQPETRSAATVSSDTPAADSPELPFPTSQSVSPEPAISQPTEPEFAAFELQSPVAQSIEEAIPDMAFEPVEPSGVIDFQEPAGDQSPVEDEMSELMDFSAPNLGPVEEPIEEELPKFDLPTQSSRTRREVPVNSYAEWIQSFEDPQLEPTVARASFQTEEDSLPELPSFDMPESVQPDVREATEPLVRIPDSQPEGPSTAVPPVPMRESSQFHEPHTIPVFPVVKNSSEPVAAPPEFDASALNIPAVRNSNEAPTVRTTRHSHVLRTHAEVSSPQDGPAPKSGPVAKNVPARGRVANLSRSGSKPAGDNSPRGNSNNARAAAQRRSATAATGKPQASGHTPESKSTNGMLAKLSTVKSSLSNAVARVPKPDLDTPMWVDRIADWRDQRFGNKNSTAPQISKPQQAIVTNELPATPPTADPRRIATTNSSERRSASRVTRSAMTSTSPSGNVANSSFRPRPNVTTVPRSGVAAPAVQTAQAPSQTLPSRLVSTEQESKKPVRPAEAQEMQFESLQIPSTQPQVAANATTGPTTPVPPRPQITPALVPMTAPATAPVANAGYRHDATQPGPPQVARTSHEHVARQQPTVQQASSHEFALQPSTMHPAVVQPISTPSTASQHMPSQASVVTRTYQPAPHPNAYPATLQRYVTHSHEYGSNYATSQRAYGKQSAVQPTQRVTRSIAATERTEYVGTLDAFNMRMTMVVRPPGMANFGMKPVSQWFSGPSSMDPAESSPTLHRVSSTMRYAAQPRAIR